MANIYIKVPTAVAQWYRGRYKQPLTEFQPVMFSVYQDEMAIMAADIMLVPESQMDHTACFSERMWKNILNGRKPQGGKVLLKRDPTEWPTMEEINFLTKMSKNNKTDGYDYLCLQAPKAIHLGSGYKQVTSSFTMTSKGASELIRYMRKEFIRVMLHEVCEEIALNDKRGLKRDAMSCIDRFFYRNNICLGTNTKDRDTMRRMATRWMEEARMLGKDVKDEEVLFVYEREQANKNVTLEEIIEGLKDVNEGKGVS